MRKFVAAVTLALLASGLANAGDIVIPEDTTPFEVKEGDVVRIPANGIAGTVVTAKVTGMAKETINSVSTRVKGKQPIGPGNHEVEVKPTAKGKVKVEVTIKPPNGKAETHTYEFEVK